MKKFILKYCSFLWPRLGMLVQHEPKPLRLPAQYRRASDLADLPTISIVTPSYNQAKFIDRTIDSVLRQDYPGLEYYVQDGNSSDGSVDVLRRRAEQAFIWESRPDDGQSQAINIGFSKTTGDIMAWLNSDDLLLPGALNYVADYFIQHPEVDVVYGNRLLINEDGQQVGRWIMPSHNDEVMSWMDYIPQETLFWRRSLWQKSGGYIDESFRFAMDWELLLRFREAGARFSRLPRFLGGFRVHTYQKTTADMTEVGLKEMGRIRKRALGYVPSKYTIRRNTWPYLIRHVFTDWWWLIRSGLIRH